MLHVVSLLATSFGLTWSGRPTKCLGNSWTACLHMWKYGVNMGAVSWEDYTHHELGRDAAYHNGLRDILSILRYNASWRWYFQW